MKIAHVSVVMDSKYIIYDVDTHIHTHIPYTMICTPTVVYTCNTSPAGSLSHMACPYGGRWR